MKKGSISVYLCLVLCVILSLIFVCMDSARLSAGRAAVSISMEEGLFSLFSNYDRTLYEKYGLMVLDAGFGTDDLRVGALTEELSDQMEAVLSPPLGILGTTPQKLYRISIGSNAVTGYQLATDQQYLPLRKQICSLMIKKIGVDGIGEIGNLLEISSEAFSEYSFSDDREITDLLEEYEQKKERAEELQAELAESEPEVPETPEEDDTETAGHTVTVPAGFVNPLENISLFLSMGLYAFVLPPGSELSVNAIDLRKTTGRRTLKQGMNLMSPAEAGAGDRILLGEYALDFFPNYRTAKKQDRLQYQAEYILAGKWNDTENLKSVLDRLLLIREGLNYFYLFSSPARTAEAESLAAIICTVLAFPEGTEEVSQLLLLVWAYVESCLDIKALLAGGKVPVFKDDTTWQADIGLLGTVNANTAANGSGRGLTYEEYLRVLLFLTSENELTTRIADMLEYNRREEEDQEDFCLDSCMVAFEAEYRGRIAGHDFTIRRGYRYEE